jgi:RNA polymerase sigma factor (sigma-70 family)
LLTPSSFLVSPLSFIYCFVRSPTFAEWAHAVNSTVPELKRQIRRSQKAKAALVEANFRLVVSVARQTIQLGRSETLNFQDACQEGILGLMRAVDKYDPTLGFRFSTYAIWWIKKMIHANLSQQGRQVRLPPNVLRKINDIRIQERVLRIELNRKPSDEEVAAKVGITLEQLYLYRNSANDIISLDKQVKVRNHKNGNHHGGDAPSLHALVQDTSTSTPTELVEHAMLREDVNQLIVSSNLHPREQAVIRLRFGIGTSINPQSLEEVAKKFKVDKEVIRSLETKAIRKLRQYRNMKSMKSYLQDL